MLTTTSRKEVFGIVTVNSLLLLCDVGDRYEDLVSFNQLIMVYLQTYKGLSDYSMGVLRCANMQFITS